MEIYNAYDIVVLPFPFTDRATLKRRPALIISSDHYQAEAGHIICAMITTASGSNWPSDSPIQEWELAGLPKASKVRLKVFTLDQQFVLRRLGRLSRKDIQAVSKRLKQALVV